MLSVLKIVSSGAEDIVMGRLVSRTSSPDRFEQILDS